MHKIANSIFVSANLPLRQGIFPRFMRGTFNLTLAMLFLAGVSFADAPEATDIDSIFKGREYQLPKLDSSYRAKYDDVHQAKKLSSSQKEQEGIYVLQFDAVADFDAAQARRVKLQSLTGYSIQMVFDAPFYKLRGGYFTKKSDAEDKANGLSLQNIPAFVVKIK